MDAWYAFVPENLEGKGTMQEIPEQIILPIFVKYDY